MKNIFLLLGFLPLCLWGQKFQLIVVSKQYQIPIGLDFVGKIHVLCEGNCFYTIDSMTSDKGTISQNTEGAYEIHIPSENPNHSSQTTRKYKIHAVMRVGEERIAVDMQGAFEAVRPEINVYNAAGMMALYRNCLNILHFSVPPFWKDSELIVRGSPNLDMGSCSIGGHQIMPKGEEGKATIEIKRLEKGKMLNIGTITFWVIDPPHPEMYVYANGKRIQSGDSISAMDRINFEIVPNSTFRNERPNDACYGTKRIEVFEKYENQLPSLLMVFEPKGLLSTSYDNGYDLSYADDFKKEEPVKESKIDSLEEEDGEWGFGDSMDGTPASIEEQQNKEAEMKQLVADLTFIVPKPSRATPRTFIFTIPEIYRRNGKWQHMKEDMPPQKFVLYEKK